VKSRADPFSLPGGKEDNQHEQEKDLDQLDAADYYARTVICPQSCANRQIEIWSNEY